MPRRTVPRRTTHVPQHRAEPSRRPALAGLARDGLRHAAWLTGAAVLTGTAVSSAVTLGVDPAPAAGSAALSAATLTEQSLRRPAVTDPGSRVLGPSRSDARTPVDTVKRAALDQDPGGARTQVEDLSRRDPRTVARALLPQFGFDAGQFSCLDSLYASESGWDVHADNPSSSAYGIPQALPGAKMASAGPRWEDDAATQIRWGLGYIKARYGSPCSAWSFKQGNNWY